MAKKLLRFLPPYLVRLIIAIKYGVEDCINSFRPTQKVFQYIYRQHKWGKGEKEFCSGPGSISPTTTLPYISLINEFLREHPEYKVVVDLGCGDLEVSKGYIDRCERFIGVDIVPELIEYLKSTYSGANTEFVCLDIIKDELPKGDVCLIRQVFQHLSNEEILEILPKLRQYKVIFITEHYPVGPVLEPNKNIVHGGHIRAYKNSAVFLDKPPFNIPSSNLELVLEVPGIGLNEPLKPGVIRTYKLTF